MNSADFRNGMRHLTAAVNIIATDYNGERIGLTATAACSLTSEPPMLLVCVNKNATAHEAIRRSGRFTLNVLSTDDVPVSARFSSGSNHGRFETGDWVRLPSGSPALDTALVTFDCTLAGEIPVSSHSIFLGQVQDVVVREGRDPLIYTDGKYAEVTLLP